MRSLSQREVLEVLQDLGGRATPREIAEAHKRKFPDSSLDLYVWTRLYRLRKWGFVKKNLDGSWSIVGPSEESTSRKTKSGRAI